MYQIKKITALEFHESAPKVYGTASTLNEAKSMLPDIVCIEEDSDYPDHFDVFTTTCEVFTIEPMGA